MQCAWDNHPPGCFLEITLARVRFEICLTDDMKVHSPQPGDQKAANLKYYHCKPSLNVIRLLLLRLDSDSETFEETHWLPQQSPRQDSKVGNGCRELQRERESRNRRQPCWAQCPPRCQWGILGPALRDPVDRKRSLRVLRWIKLMWILRSTWSLDSSPGLLLFFF